MWSVFFVFLSYLDRDVVRGDFLSRALDAEKENEEMFSMINGTFCAKMSIIGDNFLYQVSDGAEVVRTVVSPTGKLVNCSITVNQIQVKSFMHECRLGLKEKGTGSQLDGRFTHMDEAKMMCEELNESVRKNQFGKDEKVLKRSKRGFTYPGTLWCGAGNMADEYGQLGEFADTDSCCRTHDHCPHVIHAFSSKYGHTNFKWHSICHCDCDEALKSCLRQVNDSSSRIVGQAFFNVIGVPCFEFAYEEQCAERHWYGICKRYEKLPIAVLRDAVPYDFGGIDVIDELPIAPSKPKEPKESKEEKPESTTQSTAFGPDEPSLRNVVTAAEDFIKVLATVSTSQSSAADSDKDEAQSSEKKKKTSKKKKINKKPKGKGRKKKQKTNTSVRAEEGATTASPSGNKAEEVLTLNNFISESKQYNPPGMNTKRVHDGEYELRVKEESSNEVMKDEPAIDKLTVSYTSPPTGQIKSEELSTTEQVVTKAPSTSTETNVLLKVKPKGHKKERRKKNKKAMFSSKDFSTNTSQNSYFPSIPPVSSSQPEQQNFSEQQFFTSTSSAPIVIPNAQRIGSKGRKDRKGRKKRRKVKPAAPTVPADHRDSSVDSLKVIPFTSAPTTQSVPTSELELSHTTGIYRKNVQVTELSPPVNVLKRNRLKERGLRNKKRKSAVSPSSENPLFLHSNSEHLFISLTTPENDGTLKHFESNAEIQQTQWRLFTTAAPTVSEIVHWYTTRQPRKAQKKVVALIDDVGSNYEQIEPVTLVPSLNVATSGELISKKTLTTTSAALIMSPLQLSIEKVKAQFNRKKRRKHVRSNRHA